MEVVTRGWWEVEINLSLMRDGMEDRFCERPHELVQWYLNKLFPIYSYSYTAPEFL